MVKFEETKKDFYSRKKTFTVEKRLLQ